MITSLQVSNFRSLGQDVRIELGPLTALVGPNGSGKSNVVDVLRFLADVVHLGLRGAIDNRGGIQAVRRWSSGHPFNVAVRANVSWPGGSGVYAFELKGDSDEDYAVKSESAEVLHIQGTERARFKIVDGVWDGPSGLNPVVDPLSLALPLVGGDARFAPLVRALQNVAVYAIFPDTLRAPQKYSAVRPMERQGTNWASVLKDDASKAWRDELALVLNKLTGDIDAVKVEPGGGFLFVKFRHVVAASDRARAKGARAKAPAKWFDAGQESDGTLRVAGIVTACLQDPPVALLGVEEPELTVHPGAIPLLVDQLKQASVRSQVVLTTHSPEVLDMLSVGEVRVVTRQDGTTRVVAMEEAQQAAVRDGLLTLGEVLRNEGIRPELPFIAAEH